MLDFFRKPTTPVELAEAVVTKASDKHAALRVQLDDSERELADSRARAVDRRAPVSPRRSAHPEC